jgi:hypothetical protein
MTPTIAQLAAADATNTAFIERTRSLRRRTPATAGRRHRRFDRIDDDPGDMGRIEAGCHFRGGALDGAAGESRLGVGRPGVEDGDLLPPGLAGEGLVEGPHRCLGRTVGGHARKVRLGDDPGDVHERRPLVHLRQRRLGQHDRHEGVGEEQLLHGVDAELADRAEGHDTDRVDHDVERSRVPYCLGHCVHAVVGTPQIERDTVAGHSEGVEPLGSPRHQGQDGASGGELGGDGAAEATGGTGDERRGAGEAGGHGRVGHGVFLLLGPLVRCRPRRAVSAGSVVPGSRPVPVTAPPR